jgi:hypothetical protein
MRERGFGHRDRLPLWPRKLLGQSRRVFGSFFLRESREKTPMQRQDGRSQPRRLPANSGNTLVSFASIGVIRRQNFGCGEAALRGDFGALHFSSGFAF